MNIWESAKRPSRYAWWNMLYKEKLNIELMLEHATELEADYITLTFEKSGKTELTFCYFLTKDKKISFDMSSESFALRKEIKENFDLERGMVEYRSQNLTLFNEGQTIWCGKSVDSKTGDICFSFLLEQHHYHSNGFERTSIRDILALAVSKSAKEVEIICSPFGSKVWLIYERNKNKSAPRKEEILSGIADFYPELKTSILKTFNAIEHDKHSDAISTVELILANQKYIVHSNFWSSASSTELHSFTIEKAGKV